MTKTGVVLVVGGARSGKSSFAQELTHTIGEQVVYVATAQGRDQEMEERIAKHQASRPPNWETVEAPFDVEEAINTWGERVDVVLVDCMTLYVSNLIMAEVGDVGDGENPDIDEALGLQIETAVEQIVDGAKRAKAIVIFVTNEVGQGLVPPYRLGRMYRDVVGRVNQRLAQAADKVYQVTAGIAVELKQHRVTVEEASRELIGQ